MAHKNSQSSNPIEKPLPPGSHMHPTTNFITKIGQGTRNAGKQQSQTAHSIISIANNHRLGHGGQKQPAAAHHQPHYQHLQFQPNQTQVRVISLSGPKYSRSGHQALHHTQ